MKSRAKRSLQDVVGKETYSVWSEVGVSYERVSKRGDHYSVADEAYNEFARWFDYPWD